jgi:hypothetical protein
MTLPVHPANDDTEGGSSPRRRTQALVIAMAVAIVAVIVVLHLTGVIKH